MLDADSGSAALPGRWPHASTPPSRDAAGTVCHVPVASLRCTYAPLRPGVLPTRRATGADLPLRVALTADGAYEILDGFKRFARWVEQGHDTVPVVLESADGAIQRKCLLLAANSPPRTLTAMDEARVVASLVHEDDLSPRTAAQWLGRKPDWIERRLAFATRLSPQGQDRLAKGGIGPALATALTALSPDDQNAILDAIVAHAVPPPRAQQVVAAYRVADAADRRALVADPLGQLAASEARRPSTSPRAAALERTLVGFGQALAELAVFRLPNDLAPPERRRLEAVHRTVLAALAKTAAALCPTAGPTLCPPVHDPTPRKEMQHDRNHCPEPDRSSSLLEGLASAFVYFDGVARRAVVDNMATAVLGRLGADGKILWHPRFFDFLTYYGCQAFACRVKDPDRKGKKEKSFRLVWDGFLKGAEFASWEDLDERRRVWLGETPGIANCRVHGTTRRVPNEAWAEERPLLIRLPERRFPVYDESARIVDRDSTLSIRGTRYTVPAHLASRSVAVRLFAGVLPASVRSRAGRAPGGRRASTRRRQTSATHEGSAVARGEPVTGARG